MAAGFAGSGRGLNEIQTPVSVAFHLCQPIERLDGATGDKTVSLISPNNSASLRVAAKLGYRELCRKVKGGEPEILFERQRGET